MKVAVLSDIHGNLTALTAVTQHISQWQPDIVIVNGDIVNGLPDSRACWQWVQAQPGWQVVRGNHEEYVAEWDNLAEVDPLTFRFNQISWHTYQQMNGQVAEFWALPLQTAVSAPDGSTLAVTHASVRGIRDGIFAHTPDDEVAKQIAPETAVFVTAHTHQPFIRRLNGTQIVNVGAVGLPGDGDRRASYGRFTWTHSKGWQAHIVRVPYNWQQAKQSFFTTGYLETVGPMAHLSLAELQYARDFKARWARTYQQAVRDGRISLEASVQAVLNG